MNKKYEDFFADEKVKKKALDVALDIRKFEIELYWKRATYFWVFISLSFAAYFSVMKNSFENDDLVLVIISYVGVGFSLSWSLVNRGSKFWQKNWETHVDKLEDDIMGPLYKLMLSEDNCKCNPIKPHPFSVSKINMTISLYIHFILLAISAYSITMFYSSGNAISKIFFWISTIITLIFIVILLSKMESSRKVNNRGFIHRGENSDPRIIN